MLLLQTALSLGPDPIPGQSLGPDPSPDWSLHPDPSPDLDPDPDSDLDSDSNLDHDLIKTTYLLNKMLKKVRFKQITPNQLTFLLFPNYTLYVLPGQNQSNMTITKSTVQHTYLVAAL